MKKYEKEVQQAYLDSEKRTLKRLEEVYEDSLGEINERIEMLLARDDANLQNVIYQVDYQRALKKQVETILDNLQNNEFETVSEYLTESYEDGFIGNLYSMQQQGVPFAFPMDQELIVDAIQHETMLTSSLYTELGLDIKRLQKNIAGEISRGIASSMTYAEIARNVSNYSKIPRNRAMTIARTESHRIRETAVAHSQEKAVAKGADLVRVWDSVMDGKTRSKHLHLDGQKRRVNEPFEAGGKKVMRPGQFGDPADDCNCRCMARCVASWALDADETKRLGNVSKMDDERKKEIADKLKIPVDELENYSKEIIPIKAKDFNDFKKQYKRIYNPDSAQKINNGKALENNGKSSTIKTNTVKDAIASGKVSVTVNTDKQNRHIKGSSGYIEGRSYMKGTVEDAQKLITELSGTGEPVYKPNGEWNNKEKVVADKVIGVNIDPNTMKETDTSKATIHYSKTGSHIIPRKEE